MGPIDDTGGAAPPADELLGPEAAYPFGPGFRRKLLALACRTDLMRQAPGCFQARFFGPAGALAGRLASPQELIARCIEAVWAAGDGHRERPTPETIDELLRERAPTLGPEARAAVEEEWRAVRAVEVSDPRYTVAKLRRWAQDEALLRAVERGHLMLQQARGGGGPDPRALRKLFDDAMVVGMGSGDKTGRGYWADFDARVGRWGRADDRAQRVSTGFPPLDRAMDGGPGPGEVIYWLAPPKGGKTLAQLSCAMAASRRSRGVAWFSYEMGLEAMLRRMDRHVAQRDRAALRADPRQLRWAGAGWRSVGAGEVWVEQFQARKQGCEEAARRVEALRANGMGIDLVIVDYLNIMSAAQREREKRHELSAISREIKALAVELGVPVWSAALVNRQAVDKYTMHATDIGEAFEVISVMDGGIAICATREERAKRDAAGRPKAETRRFFAAVMREEESEVPCGTYELLAAQMRFRLVSERWPQRAEELERGSGDGGGV